MIKLWTGLGLLLVGCGGSSPEPAEPSPEAASPATTPSEPLGEEAVESEPAVGSEAPEASAEPAVGSEDEERPLGATVEETRTTEVIRDVVNRNRDSIRRCYDDLSQEEKGAGGTLTIAFKLGPKGGVQSATLNEERSTLKPPKLVSCAVAAIQAMKFPPSSRGFESSVNYPFNFKP